MTLERVTDDGAGVARWIHTARPAAELAERIAGTDFVPRAMRGNAPAVAACIMYGDEIGVGPMTALQGVHVIDGRPFLSAELMRALVLAAGHVITVVESSGTICRVVGYRMHDGRPIGEPITVEWNIEMARAAGLAGKGAWRSYPRALLLARASADLCRMAFPDIVRGLGHVPEAPDDVSDWTEYAESLGPETPAPAKPRTETVQWDSRRKATWDARELVRAVDDAAAMPDGDAEDTSTAMRPPAGPDYPPWEDAPAQPSAAATEAPTVPEDTPTAEAPAARLVSEQSITRIMAAYGDLPFGPDRDTRLALFSAIVGRPVESTKELERMEAFRLLGGLHDLRTGRTVAVTDGHGTFTIHAGAEPPEDE
jgi:hypothetical protein